MVVLFCFLCYFCFVPLLFLFCSFVVVAVCLLFASAYHVVRLRVAVCRDCPTEDGGGGGGGGGHIFTSEYLVRYVFDGFMHRMPRNHCLL